MNIDQLTLFIKKLAEEAGFDLVRVTDAGELMHADYLAQWISDGYNAGMHWIEHSFYKRTNIYEVMPECLSVIVVAQNYYSEKAKQNFAGQIARYSSLPDYHLRMLSGMKMLCAELFKILPELKFKIYADTGPVMEKLLAMKAGIGWQGKNSLIINRTLGSWTNLGVILMNQELNYDEPAEEFCGNCSLCIEACPAGAIVKPYVVNASKCISYINQFAEQIPSNLKNNLRGYIFGCDICQEICPWNKKAIPARFTDRRLPLLYSRDELEGLLHLSEQDFLMKYNGFPISELRYQIFRRNISYVLQEVVI